MENALWSCYILTPFEVAYMGNREFFQETKPFRRLAFKADATLKVVASEPFIYNTSTFYGPNDYICKK